MTGTSDNIRSAASSFDPQDREWQAFEALPSPIRGAIREYIYQVCAVFIWQHYLDLRITGRSEVDACRDVISAMRTGELAEISMFGSEIWPRKYGAYPPLAAQSTIMRYNERALHARGNGSHGR